MSIIYKKNGDFDVSDEGKQVKDIEDNIDFTLFIKRLPKKDRKIAEMLSQGYTQREIVGKVRCSFDRIQEIRSKLDKMGL